MKVTVQDFGKTYRIDVSVGDRYCLVTPDEAEALARDLRRAAKAARELEKEGRKLLR